MFNATKRDITIRQLLLASKCLHSALVSPEMRQRAKALAFDHRSNKELVKSVARSLMQDNQQQAAGQVQKTVATRPLSEQKAIIRQARVVAEQRIADLEKGDEIEMGVQSDWYDTETGWTINYRHARIETLDDEKGDFVQLLSWTDNRSVRNWQKETARMFGLMEYILQQGERRVKMVMKTITEGETVWEEWLDAPEDALELLKSVQGTLNRLEAAREAMQERPAYPGALRMVSKVPERKAGKHCNVCPVRLACQQGTRFLNRVAAEELAAAATSRKNHRSYRKAA